jgi:hypothetical protein
MTLEAICLHLTMGQIMTGGTLWHYFSPVLSYRIVGMKLLVTPGTHNPVLATVCLQFCINSTMTLATLNWSKRFWSAGIQILNLIVFGLLYLYIGLTAFLAVTIHDISPVASGTR